ncbi:hypothetical protein DAPPUDRAFT_114838 [Daphnia pulex]|uniref:Uncharacterized protein n=1 Tax=Daphnia pulex TaxID=6669 RepID=E9HJF4_DAPPU|nr:hypothetical protein DAPPUDRAFT_114838 [Daphnia pulex]|eukprot:EFX68133.1 hypothetical protein DAPPUDRAFT_114838 [Daphnia pulex]
MAPPSSLILPSSPRKKNAVKNMQSASLSQSVSSMEHTLFLIAVLFLYLFLCYISVGVPEPAKSVRFNLDLATQREGQLSQSPVYKCPVSVSRLSSPSSVSVCCFYTPVVPASQFVRLHCPSIIPRKFNSDEKKKKDNLTKGKRRNTKKIQALQEAAIAYFARADAAAAIEAAAIEAAAIEAAAIEAVDVVVEEPADDAVVLLVIGIADQTSRPRLADFVPPPTSRRVVYRPYDRWPSPEEPPTPPGEPESEEEDFIPNLSDCEVRIPALTSIAEEEEVVFDDTITDPARLKRFRTTAKMIHTNAGKKLMQSVKVGEDRDTVRALRALYVRDFDSLEKHHDRYVRCNAPNCSQDDFDGERDWIQAVIYDHQAILAKCDDYLVQTNPKPASTVSRASSRHSSVSSRQARIHEAERKEREAQLMLRQVEDETRRREEEDAKIREAEDYKRKVESERKQREIRDEIDLQRLSGAIMRQQLNDVTVNDQAAPTRASSVVSGLSRVSRVSSHPSIPNNSTLLAQTPTVFTQASTMATTAPMIRPMATPRTQPSAAAISTAAQTQAMTTPLAPTSTVPSFVPPTSASVAAPVSTSAAHPFTPVTTATIHVPTTSNATHVPVSVPLPPRSSASAPLPPVSSASASSWFSSWRNVGQPNLFGPRQPAQPPSAPPAQPPSAPPAQPPSAPPAQPPSAPPVQPPSAPPAQPPSAPPAQPPFVPPAQPPFAPPAQPPSFPPASSASHAWPSNPPPITSIQMSTVPTSSIPTSATQVTSAPPHSTSHIFINDGRNQVMLAFPHNVLSNKVYQRLLNKCTGLSDSVPNEERSAQVRTEDVAQAPKHEKPDSTSSPVTAQPKEGENPALLEQQEQACGGNCEQECWFLANISAAAEKIGELEKKGDQDSELAQSGNDEFNNQPSQPPRIRNFQLLSFLLVTTTGPSPPSAVNVKNNNSSSSKALPSAAVGTLAAATTPSKKDDLPMTTAAIQCDTTRTPPQFQPSVTCQILILGQPRCAITNQF